MVKAGLRRVATLGERPHDQRYDFCQVQKDYFQTELADSPRRASPDWLDRSKCRRERAGENAEHILLSAYVCTRIAGNVPAPKYVHTRETIVGVTRKFRNFSTPAWPLECDRILYPFPGKFLTSFETIIENLKAHRRKIKAHVSK